MVPRTDRNCRACGHVVHELRPVVLAELLTPISLRYSWPPQSAVTSPPMFLRDFCVTCLARISRHVPTDDQGDPLRNVNLGDVNLFLADWLRQLADRRSTGKPLLRCEHLKGARYGREMPDVQCEHFATSDWEGHKVCAYCRRRGLNGERLKFYPDEVRVRPFVYWAKSPDDLQILAMQDAKIWRTSHEWEH